MKSCYGKCDHCVWRNNGGCSMWNGWEETDKEGEVCKDILCEWLKSPVEVDK